VYLSHGSWIPTLRHILHSPFEKSVIEIAMDVSKTELMILMTIINVEKV